MNVPTQLELCLYYQLDNNALDDGLSLAMITKLNEQISEVILMLGKYSILVSYQINAHYKT